MSIQHLNRRIVRRARNGQSGFTLVELLMAMAITTVILGATMVAMSDAVRATDTATLLTNLNNGLRTSMDLMVRDMLQVGQGLPNSHVIFVPSGAGAQPLQLPGPPGTNYTVVGLTEWSAVMPGPGMGPQVNGQPTDMITTVAADSSFDQRQLSAFAVDGSSVTVALGANGANITDGGPDDLFPGDLIMLTKGSTSTLAQITAVNGQQITFAPNDSLNLNQTAAATGTILALRNEPPVDPNGIGVMPTRATRIFMITYYIDVVTDPTRPRLVRRINNGDPVNFDNTLGTVVAFDVENLQITFDLVDGVTNPANVRMVAADLDGTGACAPDPCSPNQIRKVNLLLAARSRMPLRGSNQFFRNRLMTQVSFRSLAFFDEYQ